MTSITFNSRKFTTAGAFQVTTAVTGKKMCTQTSQLDLTQQIGQSSVSSNNRYGNETSGNGIQASSRCKNELKSHEDAINKKFNHGLQSAENINRNENMDRISFSRSSKIGATNINNTYAYENENKINSDVVYDADLGAAKESAAEEVGIFLFCF